MLERILSEAYLKWYRKSPYRARIDLVAEKLSHLRYSDKTIAGRVHEWIRFINYCTDLSIDIPQTIHAQEIKKYIEWRLPKGSESYFRCVKASLRIFIEADDHGNFSRRIHSNPKHDNGLFKEWVLPYVLFLQQHKGVSEESLHRFTQSLREFTEFLEKRNIHDFKVLKADEIHNFCIGRGNRKPITWNFHLGCVRRFLKYVFLHHGLEKDLSLAVETVRRYHYSRIYDVLTEPEVNKILGSVDLSSATGKRDHAILLLAARYGMRPSDIRRLRFENIQWRLGQIVFCQSKTGKQLILPLLPDVSEALIDYIRSGRPSTDARNIFVRHKAPFESFAPHTDLSSIIKKAFHCAEMDERPGARGMCLFRHTLASNMLGANISIKTIGDVLGHASSNSTFGYTKIDLTKLRTVSLSIEEVLK